MFPRLWQTRTCFVTSPSGAAYLSIALRGLFAEAYPCDTENVLWHDSSSGAPGFSEKESPKKSAREDGRNSKINGIKWPSYIRTRLSSKYVPCTHMTLWSIRLLNILSQGSCLSVCIALVMSWPQPRGIWLFEAAT